MFSFTFSKIQSQKLLKVTCLKLLTCLIYYGILYFNANILLKVAITCKFNFNQPGIVVMYILVNNISCVDRIIFWLFLQYPVQNGQISEFIIKMQNICNLVNWNSTHISETFNCYRANINGIQNARKLGSAQKHLNLSTNLKHTCTCMKWMNTE